MEDIVKKSNFRAWLMFAAGCVMVIANFGLLYGMMSVCMYPISVSFGVGLGVVALFFTFKAVGAICIDSFLAPILEKLGARKMFILASVGGTLCFFAMSFAKNAWVLNIMAIFLALFLEMNSLAPIIMCIQNWFKKNTNLVIGILSACAAGGSAIMSPIFIYVFNAFGVKGTFIAASIIFFVCTFIAQFAFVRTPEEIGLVPYGWTEGGDQAAVSATASADAPVELPGMTLKEAARTPVLYLVGIAVLFCTSGAQYGTYLSSMCQSINMLPAVVATCVSLLNVCACLGNISMGWIRDKLGGMKMSIIGLSMYAIGGVLYLAAYSTSSVPLMVAGVVFCGFGGCLGVSLSSFTASSACGPKDFSKIYGVLVMCANIAGAIISPVYGFIFDASSSFVVPLMFMIGLTTLAIPCMIVAIRNGQKHWNPDGQFKF